MDIVKKQYRVISGCNVVCLLAIAALAFLQSANQGQVWEANEKAKTNMTAAADIEKARVEQAKATADLYEQNQIAQVDGLIINDYTLGEFAPELNWQNSVDPSKQTRIFDQFRKCIGYAYQGQFFFIKSTPNACN